MSDLESKLINHFTDREYREGYASGFLGTWISQQLSSVREQRGLTQAQLAALIGTKQSGISRMERDDYGRWNLMTLQKAAFALGCRLKVSLETFGSLIKEAIEFSERSLKRDSFEEDPVFAGLAVAEGPIGELQRKVIPWLLTDGPKERLANWLQGYDLPAVGDEIPPADWLLQATPADLQINLARYVNAAIADEWHINPPARHKEDLVRNLLRLARGLRLPLVLGESIWEVFRNRERVNMPECDNPGPEHPLVEAVMYNQPDFRYEKDLWVPQFLRQREGDLMPEYVAVGMLGMAHVGLAPNAGGIVRAASEAKKWMLPASQVALILQYAFEEIWSEFPGSPETEDNVVLKAYANQGAWSRPIEHACAASMADESNTEKQSRSSHRRGPMTQRKRQQRRAPHSALVESFLRAAQ